MSRSLRFLSPDALLEKTKILAAEERKITLEILNHLREIDRRRLFALRGFSSLFDYATRELGYSAAAAQRRISAMHLLVEIPDVEEIIQSGDLNLTNIAQAQRLFNAERKLNKPIAIAKKKAILESLVLKSTREAEQTLLAHSSQPVQAQRPDRVRSVTSFESEIRFIADRDLVQKLERVRGLIAHKIHNPTLCELFKAMAEIAIEKLEPKKPMLKKLPGESSKELPGKWSRKCSGKLQHNSPNEFQETFHEDSRQAENVKESEEPQGTHADLHSSLKTRSDAGAESHRGQPLPAVNPKLRVRKSCSRFIPAPVRREVYHRDQGRCQYLDPQSGRKCHSNFILQFDHVRPFAMGGSNTADNLQLLCAGHNRARAVQAYGYTKMAPYLRSKP